ncbi:hypothetical protein ACNJYD_18255 [Bradyrhizobium sp. DASA03005]|uniref:hypothetical protein n=1 Tax=Bradyrhizobium TaxID=374 RepID=UPI00155F4408|nr:MULTISPECIES: hypothetical protein [Bradyrhizobium]MBR1168827.1 hypothetical protein [Bradyrhizobium liaoningense]MDD1516990.1 hypothetical protein [Bradyrhizobium sp. WBAH30]MDD1543187.1 hypothetical protein [Bradyrhizobium sp. WBAH41]MDD1562843.1 hypothetical protein [Bradyrhizobium sp. WBAH33]MDD1590944.1 hypothetical protein [Bradyrhizobium sp. WBAH42]
MYKLTWHIYWRWILAALAFTAAIPLVVMVVEFPVMLLVAILSRMLGYPEFAATATTVVNAMIFQPVVLAGLFFAVGFLALRSMLKRAIGVEFDGKVLVLQDASSSSQ